MADSEPPVPQQRRKSFVEMLNPRASSNNTATLSNSPSNPVQASPPVPMARKSSLSAALGLAGGSNADSPFNAFARQRRASISTSTASGSPEFRNSFEDGAVIEEEDRLGTMATPPSPSFARRLSFGAQALRDARQSGTSPNNHAGRRPSSALFTWNEDSDHTDPNSLKPVARSPGTAKTGGEGFNWSDAMRDRTKRPSFSGNPFAVHNRSKSMNPTIQEPPKEMPKPAPPPPAPAVLRSKKPDHLGERMLRGDFMMD